MIKINENCRSVFSELGDFNWPDIEIRNLVFDSRQVQTGDCFVSLGSVTGQVEQYINQAIKAGAALVLSSESVQAKQECRIIPDLKNKIGKLLHTRLGSVTQTMPVIGITGTNGKSSISFYIAQLLSGLDNSAAVMGTLGYGNPNALKDTGMTTMPLDKLHLALAELSEEYVFTAMEVSSHGLHQDRLAGVHFTGAVYSNLSRDHLDYHGDMAAYAEAKALLFSRSELKFAVINGDDIYAQSMIDAYSGKELITYGQGSANKLHFEIQKITQQGLTLHLSYEGAESDCVLPLFGDFNAYNVVAAVAVCLGLGFTFTQIMNVVKNIHSVPGRMQTVSVQAGQPLILVDYAHTPDALEQVLMTAKRHCVGKLTAVVGCGGDRDTGKRAPMGEIAARYADSLIITSDNPRTEDPQIIAQQMVVNLTDNQYLIELDRALAIRIAIEQASEEDLVLIAGKGHENYQEVNGERHFFDDVVIASEVLEERT